MANVAKKGSEGAEVTALPDYFSASARLRIERLFAGLGRNTRRVASGVRLGALPEALREKGETGGRGGTRTPGSRTWCAWRNSSGTDVRRKDGPAVGHRCHRNQNIRKCLMDWGDTAFLVRIDRVTCEENARATSRAPRVLRYYSLALISHHCQR